MRAPDRALVVGLGVAALVACSNGKGSGGDAGAGGGGGAAAGGSGGAAAGGAGGQTDASPPADAVTPADVAGLDRAADAASPTDAAGVDRAADAPGADAAADRALDAASTSDASALTYDQLVLADRPVGYWAMARGAATEPDLSGNANPGTYRGGVPPAAALPNGDTAADFNGSSQYLTIPSRPAYSIPTTRSFTWEAWIRPDVLQFPNDSGGYVDWMGKCADYAPTCEWEARMYDTTNSQNRCNRLSAYVFNPGAGLGSGADWQPTCGLLQAGEWLHVVGAYTTLTQPAACPNAATYPGAIDIWVDGIPWSQRDHNPTGCMSQYSVLPAANNSPVNVGTMATDAWFAGAIGKVALYDKPLTQAQISAHYRAMTGRDPSGSCGDTCTRAR